MISIIINSRDDQRYFPVEAMYHRLLGDEPHEIIRIPDARSMCEGYNRGIAASRGQLLVFSHDDVEILCTDFASRLRGHLQTYDLIGITGTVRVVHPSWAFAGPPCVYGQLAQIDVKTALWDAFIWSNARRTVGNIQAMDGVFLACRRELLHTVRFDNAYTGWHLYDIDFTYAAFRAGLKLGVCCDFHVMHQSTGRGQEQQWREMAGIFMHKWGSTLPAFGQPRVWYPMRIRCMTNDDVVEVFSPPHWDS